MAETIEVASLSSTDRTSKEGKILKSAFLIGPSDAVKKKGKVEIVGNESSDKKSNSNSADQSGESDSSSSESSSSNSDNNSFNRPSRNYAMLEAYLDMTGKYTTEDDTSDWGDVANDPQVNNSLKDHEDRSNKMIDNSDYTTELKVKVELPKEGYTLWEIKLHSSADAAAVSNAIESKKFKAAFELAGKDTEKDGIKILSAKTYVYVDYNDKNVPLPPFIGHCRYALDSGSDEHDNAADAATVCLAVAPIEASNNKPDTKTVLTAVYNITGDITGGVLGNLLASATSAVRSKITGNKPDLSDADPESEEGISNKVSDYLKKQFKCVGDHTMYNNFLILRKFLTNQMKAKNLEFNKKDFEETIKTYKNLQENNLIYY